MGIGTALVKELQGPEMWEGLKINWGMMTDEGYALKQSMI